MIERGSGRTSGLTDWQLMDVLSMWACVQDQDTTGQWKQVAGWRKICDLAQAHLSRLREYRRGLAEAWPPATNAAARAYLAELDQLIDKVQRTHDAAAANYDALAAATRALAGARAELKPLYDEYAAKLKQKQAYEEILADPKAVAGSRLPNTPPVTDADLERLNGRARGLMAGLSGELQQAQVMLRQPPPMPKVPRQSENRDLHEKPTPNIPPIVTVPLPPPPAPRRIHTVAKASPVALPSSPGVGPVLGSAGTGLSDLPTRNPNPSPAQGPLAPSTGTSSLPAVIPPAGTAGSSGPPSRGKPNPPPPLSANGVGGYSPNPSPRSLPAGGLIGGTPATGLPRPSEGTPARRVNPVGGVIGGGAAGTAPTGSAGSRPRGGRVWGVGSIHSGPLGGSPSYPSLNPCPSTDHPRESSKQQRWDPDNPWETEEGVAPIVLPPSDDGPIDPGPAIGFGRP